MFVVWFRYNYRCSDYKCQYKAHDPHSQSDWLAQKNITRLYHDKGKFRPFLYQLRLYNLYLLQSEKTKKFSRSSNNFLRICLRYFSRIASLIGYIYQLYSEENLYPCRGRVGKLEIYIIQIQLHPYLINKLGYRLCVTFYS